MLVMGLDPGIAITGYSMVRAGKQGNGKALTQGCLRTPAHTPFPQRLTMLYDGLVDLMQEFQPEVMAVEQLFSIATQRQLLLLRRRGSSAVGCSSA